MDIVECLSSRSWWSSDARRKAKGTGGDHSGAHGRVPGPSPRACGVVAAEGAVLLQMSPDWGRDSRGRVAIAACCCRLGSVKFCCFAIILTLLKMKLSER